jgi:hypothetical protein
MGALLAALFTIFAIKEGEPSFAFVPIGLLCAFGAVIAGVFYLICWIDISRSKKRYRTYLRG